MSANTIEDIGDDIAGQMLDALTRDEQEGSDEEVVMPISDQKKYLISNINLLSVPERKDIGDIMIMNNRRNSIRECSTGSIINLDAQPDYIINQMYMLLLRKLNKRK